jgi:type IV pilus assembly protein PilA
MIMKSAKTKRASLDRRDSGGFTLVELMIVIAILGLLAAIAIPNYINYRKKAQTAQVAANLKNFAKGFIAYAIDYENFPPDCHTTDGPYGLPNAEMEAYVSVDEWAATTPLGGRYNREGPDHYGYAGISVDGATADIKYLRHLDSMLDDGNLGTGNFQVLAGRYTYIIDQ